MKYLYWLLAGIVALVSVDFAVSNRAEVDIGLWPLPDEWSMPLYLSILVILLTGIVLGGIATWISQGRWRWETRRLRRRVDALERELGATQARLATDTLLSPPQRIPVVADQH